MAAVLGTILVDLTPLRPGGENGGAKPFTIELLRTLARRESDTRFVLLTAADSHEELSALDRPNLRRVCVSNPTGEALGGGKQAALNSLAASLSARVPEPVCRLLRRPFENRLPALRIRKLLRDIRPGLLFCPFTMPHYHQPAVPTVCVVYDLQYRTYPQFFPSRERAMRDRHFRRACSVASVIVCLSSFVQGTIRQAEPEAPETIVIPAAIHQRLPEVSPMHRTETLARLGLSGHPFLLYPANFWPHKNHEALIEAYALFRRRHPSAPLGLLLTGAPGAREDGLRELVRSLGNGENIVFAGFLSEEDLAVVMQECAALIFPSLYEGFGIPVMEAISHGRPVLCSNRTSLPEVGGDAPLYFDPGSPESIAGAIETFWTQPDTAAELARRSRARAQSLPGLETMADRFWEAFQRAAGRSG